LERASANLAAHIQAHPELDLADIAYTCQVGRHAFAHRRALVARDAAEAVHELLGGDHLQFASRIAPKQIPGVVFMFTGQGSQYVNMGREIYENEPVFRETLDLCALSAG
jgi:acyl transferase domain-containing protein